ncbi:MAG: ABC transporter ATP-binding protein [Clostridiales bacterium]|nr:ABC transporter ATP-binding protein [Clostridiales bacterium]
MAVFTVLIVTGAMLFSLIRQALSSVIGQKEFSFTKKYELLLGQHLMDLDYGKIEDHNTHMLLEKIYAGRALHNYGLCKIPEKLPLLFQHLFSMAFSLAFILPVFASPSVQTEGWMRFFSSPIFGSLVLVLLCVSSAVSMYATKSLSLKVKAVMNSFTFLNRSLDYYRYQYLDGYKAGKDVRLFRQNTLIMHELNKLGNTACAETKQRHRIECRYIGISELFRQILNFSVVVHVATKALTGSISAGEVLQYIEGITAFFYGISEFAHVVTILRANNDWFGYFCQYIDLPSELHSGCVLPDSSHIEIEFRHVCFCYPGCDTYVLKDVSFILHNAEKLAIVGQNGSGKTTVIKLLCRLYDPDEGMILLNGKDIKSYKYEEYLKLLSTVFQDFRLFSFTIGENIAADDKIDTEKAMHILGKVDLKNRFECLDQHINTDFEKDGVELSGGEAQRLAIARALYRDAPIVILDEPTAALDPITESKIYEQFTSMVVGKTAVLVSHRLSSCRFCDSILVMNAGSVVQHGRHEQLLQDSEGIYANLWNAQAKYYVSRGEET